MKARAIGGDEGAAPAEPEGVRRVPSEAEAGSSGLFLLFAGELALGGWLDFRSAHLDAVSAQLEATELLRGDMRWVQVVDANSRKLVFNARKEAN